MEIVQILAKGDILAADSLRMVRDLQNRITTDPQVEPFVGDKAVAGYVPIIEGLLTAAGSDLATVSDAELDMVLRRAVTVPEFAEANAGLARFAPRDAGGRPLAGLSLIILNDAGDPLGLQSAQLRTHEIAESVELDPLAVSVITKANSNTEGREARRSSLFLLMGIALVVIIALLAAFHRTGSDVVLAVVGLILTISWTFGSQAWLSPGGADLVDPENIMIVLVPVLLIGLCVDYSLQADRHHPHRGGPDLGAGSDVGNEDPLQHGYGLDHRSHDRHRGRLHDPPHPPVPGGRAAFTPNRRRHAPGDDHHRRRAGGRRAHHGDHPVGADRRVRGASAAAGALGAVPPLAEAGIRRRQPPPDARPLTAAAGK